MDGSQIFNETSLPGNKEFYSSLAMKDITDGDKKQRKRVWEDIRIQNLGECHDLYVGRCL